MDSQNPSKQDTSLFLGICAYLGPLVILSFALANNNSFVKFHARQGAVLFVIEIIAWVLGSMIWHFWFILNIINLITLVLSILGIVNVIQHKEKQLPVVGAFGRYFNF